MAFPPKPDKFAVMKGDIITMKKSKTSFYPSVAFCTLIWLRE